MATPLATPRPPAAARLVRAPCQISGGFSTAAARLRPASAIAAQSSNLGGGGGSERRGPPLPCAAQPSHLAEKKCSPCEESGGSLEYMGLCEVGPGRNRWQRGAA